MTASTVGAATQDVRARLGTQTFRFAAGAAGALFVPMLAPLVSGRVLARDDLAAMHLPFRFLYANALRAGDSFLWMPAMRSGLFLYGEGEGGFAHPLHLLLYRFLALGTALNLEIVTSYAAMLAGGCALLLQLGFPSDAALFGATLFAFGGFNLFNLPRVNHVAALAHLPWILLFVHVLLTTNDKKRRALAFAGLAVAVGSQLLVGNPQYMWLTGLVVALTAASLIRLTSAARLGLLLVGFFAGLLIGAAQLLPTLDFIRESTRQSWTLSEALTFSLSPWNLMQLWAPFALRFRVAAPPSEIQLVHEFVVYNGAFCTVALAWLAFRWQKLTRRSSVVVLLTLALVALLLAFGGNGFLYPWLARLPGLRTFRAPARHVVLFQLALAGLAAVAFEDLARLRARGELVRTASLWPLAIPIGLSVVLTCAAAALTDSQWAASRGLLFSGLLRAAPWSALVIGVSVLVALSARGVKWAMPALIVLTAIDLGLWGYTYIYHWGQIGTVRELADEAEVPASVKPGDLIVPMGGGAPVNFALLRGVRLQTGYFGLETASVLDLADPVTRRLAGVQWIPEGTKWTAVANTMPRVRLVSRAQVSHDMRRDVASIDVADVALVGASIPALSGSRGVARIVSDRPGDIAIDTQGEGQQLLVLAERFHPGWRASEDGRPRDVIPVYGDYLGCVVDPGGHRVTFRFDPPSVRYGVWTTVVGLLLTFSVAATIAGTRS
jgi:hypothetical protein